MKRPRRIGPIPSGCPGNTAGFPRCLIRISFTFQWALRSSRRRRPDEPRGRCVWMTPRVEGDHTMRKDSRAAFLLKDLSRRHILQLGAGIGALATSAAARAQTSYPSRPVHMLLGFAAGGSSDAIGRLICQRLAEKLGQPFIFDNRPGAASNIATELVAREAPNGYSLLWCTSANAVNATLYQNLNFDFVSDFAPVDGTFA